MRSKLPGTSQVPGNYAYISHRESKRYAVCPAALLMTQ